MEIIEKKLSSAELDDLKMHKEKLAKKALSDSLVFGILTFFGLIVLLLICEKAGLISPSAYLKPVLVGLSLLSSAIYNFKVLHKLKTQESSNRNITQYIFTITDYYSEVVSNTEYVIYACKTTDNKTVVFQTLQLPIHKILDTINLEILNGKVISVKNYSTGMNVNRLDLSKQLIDNYGEEFYLLEKDINDL